MLAARSLMVSNKVILRLLRPIVCALDQPCLLHACGRKAGLPPYSAQLTMPPGVAAGCTFKQKAECMASRCWKTMNSTRRTPDPMRIYQTSLRTLMIHLTTVVGDCSSHRSPHTCCMFPRLIFLGQAFP